MQVVFVDAKTLEPVLKESTWELPPPREGDVVELHCGDSQRWVVSEVDWVFQDVPPEQHEEVPVRVLRVVVRPEGEAELKDMDPTCVCGHPKSIHAPGRCLGSASTCLCRGFEPRK